METTNDGIERVEIMEAGPMAPERKAAWIAALRSGKFVQGFGALKRFKGEAYTDNRVGAQVAQADCYCCLGLLCEIVDGKLPGRALMYGHEGSEYLGTIRPKGELDPHGTIPLSVARRLAMLNDSGNGGTGTPFAEIADWIEVNL